MYAELGRHPLLINRKISACKYLKRLETLDDRRLVKKALKQLSMDDEKGHFNWLSKILDDSKKCSVETTLPEEIIKQKFKASFENHLKNALSECISKSKKLRTYAQFKTNMKFESYLNSIDVYKFRRDLARFRLSAHDLEIERGRYNQKPKPIELRCCRLCLEKRIQAVEDEIHFLLHCPSYSVERNEMISKITSKYPAVNDLMDVNKFVWLMNQEDPECVRWISYYVSKSFEIRKSDINDLLN